MRDHDEATPTCKVLKAGGTYEGKQGFRYTAGVSAETVGAEGICLMLLTIQPGDRAKAHLHESHETAIYVISGELVMWYGERLENRVEAKAGRHGLHPRRRAAPAGQRLGRALRRGDRAHRSERAGERGAAAGPRGAWCRASGRKVDGRAARLSRGSLRSGRPKRRSLLAIMVCEVPRRAASLRLDG